MLKVYYPRQPFSSERDPNRTAWDVLEYGLQEDIEITTGLDLPQPAEYHILISGRPSAEQIEASPHLHTLLIPWAGLPDVTADLMGQHPHIAIHNLHHNAVTTAETALTLMMAAAKYLIPIERTFRSLDWRPRYAPNPAVTLHGKTVLILGYGSIGQQVGRVCAAMGMHIYATRRDPIQPTDAPGEIHPPNALHSLLPKANVLIITLPLTDETRGLIGEPELDLLPQNAVLVNVGRGAVVDQHALYQALKSERLHSAAMDVWYSYPPDEDARAHHPPADVPFHELENVVMSPHRGGGSAEIEILRMEHIVRFLNLAAEGKPLPNRVSLEKGY